MLENNDELVVRLDQFYSSFVSANLEASLEECFSSSISRDNRVVYLVGEKAHFSSNAIKLIHNDVKPIILKYPDKWIFFKEGIVDGFSPSSQDGADLRYFRSLSYQLNAPLYGLGVDIASRLTQERISQNYCLDINDIRGFYMGLIWGIVEYLVPSYDAIRENLIKKLIGELGINRDEFEIAEDRFRNNTNSDSVLNGWNEMIKLKFEERLAQNEDRKLVLVCVGNSHVCAFS